MRKILIVTDSHITVLENCIMSSILNKTLPYKPYPIDPSYELIEIDVLGNSVSILGLMGKTAFNFANHLKMLEDRDYSNHEVVLFMGFNDLVQIRKHNNIQKVVDTYFYSAINRFGNNVTFITPLKDLPNSIKNPELSDLYKKYTDYLKKICRDNSIKCHDIYSIIGDVTSIEDLSDEYHIYYQYFLPLYDKLNIT